MRMPVTNIFELAQHLAEVRDENSEEGRIAFALIYAINISEIGRLLPRLKVAFPNDTSVQKLQERDMRFLSEQVGVASRVMSAATYEQA
jgi:hypothetical protein